MLVPILLVLMLMVTLSAALFETSLAGAKIALDRKLSVYLDVGLTQGTTDYVQSVQQYVGTAPQGATSVTTMPIPVEFQPNNFAPICGTITTSSTCTLRYVMTVTPPTTTANGNSADPDTSNDLEQQLAAEQKIATVLTVSIVSQPGEPPLVTRTRYLTLRVYDSAPFATLTGVRDANTDAGVVSSAEGDTAGRNTGALDAQGAPAYSDTSIHALEICQQSGLPPGDTNGQPVAHTPASEGLPWGNDTNGGWEVSCNVSSQDISRFNNPQWDTGTANQTNWVK